MIIPNLKNVIMPEISARCKVRKISFKCDKCKKGFMQQTGLVQGRVPNIGTLYEHQCDNEKCGEKIRLNNAYPFIKYE